VYPDPGTILHMHSQCVPGRLFSPFPAADGLHGVEARTGCEVLTPTTPPPIAPSFPKRVVVGQTIDSCISAMNRLLCSQKWVVGGPSNPLSSPTPSVMGQAIDSCVLELVVVLVLEHSKTRAQSCSEHQMELQPLKMKYCYAFVLSLDNWFRDPQALSSAASLGSPQPSGSRDTGGTGVTPGDVV
jgi:hypothetical protein